MKKNNRIKLLKRKENTFVHIPVEIPTIVISDPKNPGEKISLTEAFHINFKSFIFDKDPNAFVFIKRGLDERHQDKDIRKYLIFSESARSDFDEFIKHFCETYAIELIIE